MAESQKAGTSSVKLKEKTSELDLDFGKDFMSSWKDDGMDFDFGSPAKGKKKTFDFGKLDMDFNLDGDFNKLSSSFKVDMPDLDISSPLKKAGKEKEQSKQVSSTESSRKKKDNFAFSFDFNEFDDLNFETKLEKGSARSNKSKSKEVSSSQSGSGDPGAHLAKDNVPMEEDISSKLQEERGVDPSEMDAEVDNEKTADTRDEDGISKFLTEDSFTEIPANSEENYTIETDAPENTNSVTILEKEQDKQLENVSPAEAYHLALVHDSPRQSKADNTSTQNTPSDVEEVQIPANVDPRESGEQNVSEKLLGPESNNGSSRDESVPSESVKNSPTENGDMSKFTAVNDVTNATDSSELTHSEFEHHSIPNDSRKLLQGPMTNKRNKNSASKLLVPSAKSGTAKNDSVPEIEKGSSVIQSKYFKRPNEVESQLQQAPISQKKLISTDTKRIGTTQVNLINEKVTDPKATQSGICLAGISRPQPRKLGGEPVHTRNSEGLKAVNINRDRGFPVANTIQHGSKLMSTSRTYDQDLSKEGLALIRNGKNIEDPSALSSPLHPYISHGQENKSTSKSSISFRLPPSSTTSTKDTTKLFSENNVISPDQAGRRTPELPALKNLRTTGGNLEPVNSALLKGIKSTRNSEQSMEVQENMVSKKTHFTETKKQAPPTLTLKRKTFEDSNADKLTFTPSKRLSASPIENRYASAPSDRVVNEKAINHENVVGDNTRITLKDCQTPTVDIPLDNHFTELETTLSLETDSNVEKAEALSKELEHICNMLKKKHEEAKEILVRAIVNNNNLLMLNHPMHLEKIHMVQKFAALLISK